MKINRKWVVLQVLQLHQNTRTTASSVHGVGHTKLMRHRSSTTTDEKRAKKWQTVPATETPHSASGVAGAYRNSIISVLFSRTHTLACNFLRLEKCMHAAAATKSLLHSVSIVIKSTTINVSVGAQTKAHRPQHWAHTRATRRSVSAWVRCRARCKNNSRPSLDGDVECVGKNPRRANERFGPENNASHVHVFGIGPWYHSSREHKAPQRRPRQRRAYHQAKNAHTKIWNMRRRWRMIFCQVNFFFLFFLVRLSLFYRICDANCLLGEKPLCHTLHMTSGDQPKIGPYTKFKRFLLFYSACTPPLSCPRSFTHIYSLFSIHSYSFMLANY